MNNKLLLPLFFFFLLSIGCEETAELPEEEQPQQEETHKKFDVVGIYQMDYAPFDMVVKDNFVFACRDDKIYVIDLTNPEQPVLAATFDDQEKSNDFQALLVQDNILFAGCASTQLIYAINVGAVNSMFVIDKYQATFNNGEKLKPLAFFIHENSFWAAGSNGTSGTVVKFLITSDEVLAYAGHYNVGGSGNAFEGVWANSNNVFTSSADGKIYAFDVNNFLNGYISVYTFDAEAGHEHWGRTVWGLNNNLYWADWGAGFITLDIAQPQQITAKKLVTNSSFTEKFPEAEGTNVYDFVYHNNTGKIYVANGWSGLLEIDPANSGEVNEYVDYKDNLYYCIDQYKDYVVVSDGAAGTTDVKGVKLIQVK